MNIKKDDIVEVIAGDDAGTPKSRTTGRVLSVHPNEGKVVVEGVNRVYRHLKPSRRNPQGGRLSKEMSVQASNVALIDPTTNRPTRVGVRYLDDGTKVLVAKRSWATLRTLAKADPKYAKKK